MFPRTSWTPANSCGASTPCRRRADSRMRTRSWHSPIRAGMRRASPSTQAAARSGMASATMPGSTWSISAPPTRPPMISGWWVLHVSICSTRQASWRCTLIRAGWRGIIRRRRMTYGTMTRYRNWCLRTCASRVEPGTRSCRPARTVSFTYWIASRASCCLRPTIPISIGRPASIRRAGDRC